MSKLIVHSKEPAADGCLVRVTPRSAGWQYVGFEVYRLDGGDVARLVAGSRDLRRRPRPAARTWPAGGVEWRDVGERATSSTGRRRRSTSRPASSGQRMRRGAEFAVCTAPAVAGADLRLLGPIRHESRGAGDEAREIDHILMEDEPAESLLVTEVVTPAGHWSSYPPHKHDVDDPPRETLLEETYYHRVRPAGGFGFQRVYTDDRALDEALAVGDGDVVLVPRGYHPVAAGARHDLYYLNVMAGPVREWCVTIDPAFVLSGDRGPRAGAGVTVP